MIFIYFVRGVGGREEGKSEGRVREEVEWRGSRRQGKAGVRVHQVDE